MTLRERLGAALLVAVHVAGIVWVLTSSGASPFIPTR